MHFLLKKILNFIRSLWGSARTYATALTFAVVIIGISTVNAEPVPEIYTPPGGDWVFPEIPNQDESIDQITQIPPPVQCGPFQCCGHFVGCTFVGETCYQGGCVDNPWMTMPIPCAAICQMIESIIMAQCLSGAGEICVSVGAVSACLPLSCPPGTHRTGCTEWDIGDDGCTPLGGCPPQVKCNCDGVTAICEPDEPSETPTPEPTASPTATPDQPEPPQPTVTPTVTPPGPPGAIPSTIFLRR